MSKDYYAVLGVEKKASTAEIKKAFRQKAKEHHPDKGGDEKKFKEVNEAYEVLSNEKKRAQYDQFGAAGPQFGGGGGSGSGGFQGFGGFSTAGGGFQKVNLEDFEDIFSSFFGGFARPRQRTKGYDLEVEVEISFDESMRGTKKVFPYRNGDEKRNIEVTIPAGIDDGQTLRLTGQGEEAPVEGGQPGDLFIHVRVNPSQDFERRGYDLISVLPLSVFDAITGGKFEVKTFWEKVKLTVPENTKEGSFLRIKGKGVRAEGRIGDHLVRIEYVMPKKISSKLKDLLDQAKKY